MIEELQDVREAAFLNGLAFGSSGPYVRITGHAIGKVDAAHPANHSIAFLDKATRNAAGDITYCTPFDVLRPLRPEHGNGCLLYEATNRGKKMVFPYLFDARVQSNALDHIEHLGNAMPLRAGFTLAWCGWDAGAPRVAGGLALDAPEARDGGHPIVRTVREEFVSGTRHGLLSQFQLSYDAASLDPNRTTVTLRRNTWDTPRVLDAEAWAFVDARHIVLRPDHAEPQPGWLYDVHYPATRPPVTALAYAVTRDLVSWLRRDQAAQRIVGAPIRHTLAVGVSQAGRYLRGWVGKGFNRDEQGRRVMDGMLVHISGVGRAFVEDMFAQPFRTRSQHQDHDFPENVFPFSAAPTTDPLSGERRALLADPQCDPLWMETNTSSEYWLKGASLLHTDPLGERDVDLPGNARVYLIAGTQHDARPGLTTDAGNCVNPCNPHDPSPVLRALFQALMEWVRDGRLPPPSRVPTLAAGTLRSARALQFPRWAGMRLVDDCNDIVAAHDWIHPGPTRFRYQPLVCAVDGDGNEVDGVRMPDIAVPLGTFTGWNCFRATYPQGVLADRKGSFVPFAASLAERSRLADPRPSIEERYPSSERYVEHVRAAAQQLVQMRLLLQHDADWYVHRAQAWAIRRAG